MQSGPISHPRAIVEEPTISSGPLDKVLLLPTFPSSQPASLHLIRNRILSQFLSPLKFSLKTSWFISMLLPSVVQHSPRKLESLARDASLWRGNL